MRGARAGHELQWFREGAPLSELRAERDDVVGVLVNTQGRRLGVLWKTTHWAAIVKVRGGQGAGAP